jgi:hypothetical protein
MFGATLDAYTLFHTAEDTAQVPYLYAPEQVTLRTRRKDGVIQSINMLRQDMTVTRRFAATVDWLIDQGVVVRGKLGLGELLFIPNAQALHETLVRTLRRDPLFLVDEKARYDVLSRMKAA